MVHYKFLNETSDSENIFQTLSLKVELDGDVPNLDGRGNLKAWGELTDSATDPDECSKDSELLLFFDDCLDRNPKLFLFWNFPLFNLSLVNFPSLKANYTIFL